MTSFQWILAFVIAQRLAELVWSNRNTRRLMAGGGMELGARHYPLFILLHGSWLLSLALLVPADAAVIWPLFWLFALLQLGRLWLLASLGRYWTTRVITVPGAPLVRSGPYRFLRHPNYLIVSGEVAVVPLMVGAWAIALVFSLLNAALLRHRIAVEEAGLADRRLSAPGCQPSADL